MKVLFITLSNIGDAVLTTPALSAILENFKGAEITLVASPRAADLFKGDPYLTKVIIYRKDMSLGKKMALIKTLRAEDFDLMVDFKDTMLPFLIYAKKKTPVFKKVPEYIKHSKDRHLWKLKQALLNQLPEKDYKPLIWLSDEIINEVEAILKSNGISAHEKLIAVAPGARSHTKQWTKEGFSEVSRSLASESGYKIVLVGDQQDTKVSSIIKEEAGSGVIDLCGKTTLKQLAALLKKSSLLITNDSAPMHIAWAVQTPVVAIFGPTNYEKYGPGGPKDIIIRKDLDCSPCQLASCKIDNDCMKKICAEEVLTAARGILKHDI